MKNNNFVPMYRDKNYYVSLRKVIGGVRNRPEHSPRIRYALIRGRRADILSALKEWTGLFQTSCLKIAGL